MTDDDAVLPIRIVYLGELWSGSTCRMRCDALRQQMYDVVEVDDTYVPSGMSGLCIRLIKRLNYSVDATQVNKKLLESVTRHEPHVIWIDKGLRILPRTLHEIRKTHPATHIIHYSPDDMTGHRYNQSLQYLKCIPYYDMHVTTKSFNVRELYGFGARSVLHINNGYSDQIHHPVNLTPSERLVLGGQIGFIGGFEDWRAQSLLFLAEHGLRIRVWGDGWGKWAKRNSHPNLTVEHRGLWGDLYRQAICSFEINLGFLRKLNRDLQTTRSVEIPACGQFMLAERTSEHLTLFTEGIEAEFFGDDRELLEKCKYYLSHPAEREKIAVSGRLRCLCSGYSYEKQVSFVLEKLAIMKRTAY